MKPLNTEAAVNEITSHGVVIVCDGSPDLVHTEVNIGRLVAGRFRKRRSRTTLHVEDGKLSWRLRCPHCRLSARVGEGAAADLWDFIVKNPRLAFTRGEQAAAVSLYFLNLMLTRLPSVRRRL